MRRKNDKRGGSRRALPEGRNTRPVRRDDGIPSSPSGRVVHGLVPVRELLRSGSRRVEKILVAEGAADSRVTEIVDHAKRAGILFQKVPREVIEKMTVSGSVHQGVIAVVSAADYADEASVLEGLDLSLNPTLLLLDGVEDPRNLGAILRVAECAGVNAVFVPEHRATGITETVVKTAAGATEYIPVCKVRNLNSLIAELKEKGFWVVGSSGSAQTSYVDWDWNRPTALVMGGEGSGLHRLVSENCDALVKIPMAGKIESLNVSVATGIILFESLRQRDS
jgi:23S rRNA (guanosine2251-2'-O)-methyltransferase